MAKDGSNRGGARTGAGRKKKALSDKVAEGKAGNLLVLPTTNFSGVEMPLPREYLKAPQKSGQENCAVEIYEKTWEWLNKKGCADLVSQELIEHYAMSVSRWIQCQDAISNYGFLAKHPTTGAAIVSPYVNIGLQYMKQVNQLWYQIYQIVKENCSEGYSGANPQDDQALSSSRELTSLLVKDRRCRCIYPGVSPNAGSYPILVYNVISDVPALTADGEELERRVTIRIQILTRDGHYGRIYTALQHVMLGLGCMRSQTMEIAEKDVFVLCVDYKIGTGVDW